MDGSSGVVSGGGGSGRKVVQGGIGRHGGEGFIENDR